jgi:hypothetical protein
LKDLSEAELFKTDEYVFRLPSTNKVPSHFRLMKAFRILLTSLDLYEDLGGRSRSLYSLRHTYATNAILNGVDFETLSVQMGAGVGMLEKHYSHLKPEMRAGTLSGLDAKRRKEAKQDENEAVQKLALQMARLAEENAILGGLLQPSISLNGFFLRYLPRWLARRVLLGMTNLEESRGDIRVKQRRIPANSAPGVNRVGSVSD